MNKKVSKVLYIILLVILVPILLINLVIMVKSFVSKDEVPSIFGYKPMIVLTGSMEPTIKRGDLVLSKEVNATSLKVDDIISYRDNENAIITHRIVTITNGEDGLEFTTKGDANNTEDSIVIKENMIEGIYVNRIPGLGTILEFIQTPVGIVLVILIIVVIAFLLIGLSSGFQNKELKRELDELKNEKQLSEK